MALSTGKSVDNDWLDFHSAQNDVRAENERFTFACSVRCATYRNHTAPPSLPPGGRWILRSKRRIENAWLSVSIVSRNKAQKCTFGYPYEIPTLSRRPIGFDSEKRQPRAVSFLSAQNDVWAENRLPSLICSEKGATYLTDDATPRRRVILSGGRSPESNCEAAPSEAQARSRRRKAFDFV